MFSALDVSGSALTAQRQRIMAISNNLANISTTHDETGAAKPYQPRFVIFQTENRGHGPLGAAGVKVSSVEVANVETRWRYQPGHPDAMKEGEHQRYVAYPNIDMMAEFTDALEATRAYEANIGVVGMTKGMMQHTLRILA